MCQTGWNMTLLSVARFMYFVSTATRHFRNVLSVPDHHHLVMLSVIQDKGCDSENPYGQTRMTYSLIAYEKPYGQTIPQTYIFTHAYIHYILSMLLPLLLFLCPPLHSLDLNFVFKTPVVWIYALQLLSPFSHEIRWGLGWFDLAEYASFQALHFFPGFALGSFCSGIVFDRFNCFQNNKTYLV